jgi:hypothetical protein
MTSSTSALVPMLAIGQTLFFIACAFVGLGLLGLWIWEWFNREEDPLK